MNVGPVRGALLAAASTAALLALWPGAARAGPARWSGGGTPQCAATSFFCVTPVLYGPQPELWLAMAATAPAPNTPIIVERIDPSDPSQDWTIEPVGGQPPGAGRQPGGLGAGPSRRIPGPQLAFLEFSPAGIRSDLCAANVNDRLMLRHCNGTDWQLFIKTVVPGAGGVPVGLPAARGIPAGGWWYFLSDVRAAATGRHLAMSAAHSPGARITFAEPGYVSTQWWGQSNHCLIDRRRAGPRGGRVC